MVTLLLFRFNFILVSYSSKKENWFEYGIECQEYEEDKHNQDSYVDTCID